MTPDSPKKCQARAELLVEGQETIIHPIYKLYADGDDRPGITSLRLFERAIQISTRFQIVWISRGDTSSSFQTQLYC